MDQRLNILGCTSEHFIDYAANHGVRAARALDIYRRALRKGRLVDDASAWAALTTFPIVKTQHEHGTTKFILRHEDGLETESVILPINGSTGRRRNTLCVSSQVGCAMGCTFCETAQMGLMKSLSAAQIVAQWWAARFGVGDATRQVESVAKDNLIEQRLIIDNIVFMGMGEPMDNMDAVIQAIEVLTDRNGAAIAPGHISVSTVGRVAGILRLAELVRQPGFHKLRLAVSINAPNDEIRSQIMPINRSTPMNRLMDAMLQWPTDAKQRVLIEYVLIPGVNDALAHAAQLCEYLLPLNCTVNVIPYNPRRNSPWPSPSEASVQEFVQQIHECGQFVKRRQTIGRSVMAACGQLGNPSIRGRKIVGSAM